MLLLCKDILFNPIGFAIIITIVIIVTIFIVIIIVIMHVLF